MQIKTIPSFEKVSRFKNIDIKEPTRKTAYSAGYDFVVAEDTIVPSLPAKLLNTTRSLKTLMSTAAGYETVSLEEIQRFNKQNKLKPTLVSTGYKCYLENDEYLELSVRSSTPLKYLLILANGVGIIDSDYVDNPDNEGEIFFQLINLSPFNIQLKAGDTIGQGIIKKYNYVSENNCEVIERKGGFGSTDE